MLSRCFVDIINVLLLLLLLLLLLWLLLNDVVGHRCFVNKAAWHKTVSRGTWPLPFPGCVPPHLDMSLLIRAL